jgi:hypothetical protein
MVRLKYLRGFATAERCACRLGGREKTREARQVREKQGRSAKGGTATTGLSLENDTCEMRYIMLLIVLDRIRLELLARTLFGRECPCRHRPSCCGR